MRERSERRTARAAGVLGLGGVPLSLATILTFFTVEVVVLAMVMGRRIDELTLMLTLTRQSWRFVG